MSDPTVNELLLRMHRLMDLGAQVETLEQQIHEQSLSFRADVKEMIGRVDLSIEDRRALVETSVDMMKKAVEWSRARQDRAEKMRAAEAQTKAPASQDLSGFPRLG